jgi:enterochelin esterase-like enzyme
LPEVIGLLDTVNALTVLQALTDLEQVPPDERDTLALQIGELLRSVGSPLFHGDDLIFLFPAATSTESVLVNGGVSVALERLTGTNLFVGRVHIPNLDEVILSYTIIVDGVLAQDPWTIALPKLPNSPLLVLRGSRVQAPSQVLDQTDRAKGQVEKHLLESKYLGAPRTVWVYTPPGYAPRKQYAMLLVTDGHLYFEGSILLPTVLDNLIAEGQMPPVVAVGIDNGGDHRIAEYLYTKERFDLHEQFLYQEVLPWVQSHYRVYPKVGKDVAVGFSNGGAWAYYSVGLHPERFQGAIMQSPLTTVTAVPDVPTGKRFAFTVGTLEQRSLEQVDQLAQISRSGGNQVQVQTNIGGHDVVLAEHQLVDGLIYLWQR